MAAHFQHARHPQNWTQTEVEVDEILKAELLSRGLRFKKELRKKCGVKKGLTLLCGAILPEIKVKNVSLESREEGI